MEHSSNDGGSHHGHLVLIGHTFDSNTSADERLLDNAIFLTDRPGTVNVLEYSEFLSSGGEIVDARPTVHPFVQTYAKSLGRDIAFTALPDYRNLRDQLPSTDVLIVYNQFLAPTGEVPEIAYTWNPLIDSFLNDGGVVVVLDSSVGDQPGGGTYVFANGPNLFDLTKVTPATVSSTLETTAFAGALGAG